MMVGDDIAIGGNHEARPLRALGAASLRIIGAGLVLAELVEEIMEWMFGREFWKTEAASTAARRLDNRRSLRKDTDDGRADLLSHIGEARRRPRGILRKRLMRKAQTVSRRAKHGDAEGSGAAQGRQGGPATGRL
jgi:hypothetical protein